MSKFHQHYYDTEGPFGIPMRDRQALKLEAVVKDLPKESLYEPRKTLFTKGPTELHFGERADVSWISEESIDRQGDIVLAAGMDDSHFQLNPLVTMNHAYWLPPVGKSLWRMQIAEGKLRGIKAKTQYHSRPDDWPADADWPPDITFTLVQSGLLRGKSVGFLPLQMRRPTSDEIEKDASLSPVRFIIEEWILLEYACVYLPAQQHAIVENVSKGMNIPSEFRKALGWNSPPRQASAAIPFTPLNEIEKAVRRHIAALDFSHLVNETFQANWARILGRV